MNKHLIIGLTACVWALCACGQQRFTGAFSNGYKEGKLSFVLSADKKSIRDFTFTGYWQCDGSTEAITAGPEKAFPVADGGMNAVITDPQNGGSSAFRFDIKGTIKANTATGTFRMSIAGLRCDTYSLNWTARAK